MRFTLLRTESREDGKRKVVMCIEGKGNSRNQLEGLSVCFFFFSGGMCLSYLTAAMFLKIYRESICVSVAVLNRTCVVRWRLKV